MARTVCIALLAAAVITQAQAARAQFREERILYNASGVLDEFMSLRMQRVPRAMLAQAKGIAIIPSMIKAGFVIGGRHGKGVLLIRDEHGNWRTPVFIAITGGNIGYQIGVQATDLILIFKTYNSIDGILDGKLTLGVDAAAAAGPVGREAAAATDGQLRAEIYSYSRSRGLFAGVSVDGSVLQIAEGMNAAYYQSRGGELADNDPAVQLTSKVATYSACRDQAWAVEQAEPLDQPQPLEQPGAEELPLPSGSSVPGQLPAPGSDPMLAPPQNAYPAELLEGRLSTSAAAMSKLLDPSWNEYLAVPPQVFQAGAEPSLDALQRSLSRFDAIAFDERYRALTTREEFRTTHALLQQYQRALADRGTALRLPAPPTEGGSSILVKPR